MCVDPMDGLPRVGGIMAGSTSLWTSSVSDEIHPYCTTWNLILLNEAWKLHNHVVAMSKCFHIDTLSSKELQQGVCFGIKNNSYLRALSPDGALLLPHTPSK